MDLARTLHIAALLEQEGVTVQPFGSTGLVQLIRDGRIEATTTKATVAQARKLATQQGELR